MPLNIGGLIIGFAVVGRKTTGVAHAGMEQQERAGALSNGSRRSFFQSLSTRHGRQTKTESFDRFVPAVRRGCRSTIGGGIEETQ